MIIQIKNTHASQKKSFSFSLPVLTAQKTRFLTFNPIQVTLQDLPLHFFNNMNMEYACVCKSLKKINYVLCLDYVKTYHFTSNSDDFTRSAASQSTLTYC